jgi:acetyl esterase/lipase
MNFGPVSVFSFLAGPACTAWPQTGRGAVLLRPLRSIENRRAQQDCAPTQHTVVGRDQATPPYSALRRACRCSLALVAVLIFAARLPAQSPEAASPAALSGGELKQDIEYGTAGGESLKLDVFVPDGAGPFPVAILVHGGGWSRGDKHRVPAGDSADISPWFAPLAQAHFVWFSINYRLAPRHRWPACLADVQTAIRWVKAHAAEHKGDPQRIALFGHSAGGHLACLAAVLAGPDTRVQAVVGFAAVTDHEQDSYRRGGLSVSLQALLDRPREITPETLALLREISPINHVHSGQPPFLLIHGTADKSVPYEQSLAFQKKIRAAGGVCDLITIPGAPHAFATWPKLAPDYEGQMLDWLRSKLGKPGADAAPPAPHP